MAGALLFLVPRCRQSSQSWKPREDEDATSGGRCDGGIEQGPILQNSSSPEKNFLDQFLSSHFRLLRYILDFRAF
jgi:hypothetical protein